MPPSSPAFLLDGDDEPFVDLHPAVRRATAFLGAHFDEEFGAARLAGEAHVSTSHLSHLFKRELGLSFKRLLNQIRVERAKELLQEDPGLRITDLALEVGFGDLSHFLKTFRRIVGHSPKEYRQLRQPDDGGEDAHGAAAPRRRRAARRPPAARTRRRTGRRPIRPG